MTKSELRKARKAARAEGRPLTGELALDKSAGAVEFTESREGYEARNKWARRYCDLDGRPESPEDY